MRMFGGDRGPVRSVPDTVLDGAGLAARPLAEGDIDDTTAWEMVDLAPDGLVLVDAAGVILFVNQQIEAMFGYDRVDLLGRPVETLVPADVAADHRRCRLADASRRTVGRMGAGRELHGRRRDGTMFRVEIGLSSIDGPSPGCTMAAVRDVSERVRIEADRQRLRSLAQVSQERERLASALHDTVIHEVFATGIGLQSLAIQLDDQQLREQMLSAVDALDDVIRSIRTAVFVPPAAP